VNNRHLSVTLNCIVFFICFFVFSLSGATHADEESRLYVSNYNISGTSGNGTVSRAGLDGTNAENLGNPGNFLSGGLKIALDNTAGKMYITNYDGNSIVRANLDGTDAKIWETSAACSVCLPVLHWIRPQVKCMWLTGEAADMSFGPTLMERMLKIWGI
jgi:hypothetical protein